MHSSKDKFKKCLDSKLSIIFPILISSYLIIIYAPMFLHEGSLIQMDQPMWTAFTYLMKKEIIPDQKWFWNIITDRENAGLILGGPYSLNLIVMWLLTHFFNPALSVKIFLLLCVLSITVSIYFFSSKYLNPVIGIITALLIIPVIFKNANNGMCYSYLSFSFAFLFWISSLKFLKSISTTYWMLSVILITLSLYTHPIGIIASLSIWISLLTLELKDRKFKSCDKVLVLYFIIPFISLLLAAPQIVPIFFSISDPGQQQIIISKGSSYFFPTLKKTLNFNTYLPNYVGLKGKLFLLFFGIVGFVNVFKKDNQLKIPLISLFAVLLLLVSKMLMLSPVKPFIFYILTIYHWRFVPYLKIVYIIFVGMGLSLAYDRIKYFSSNKKMIRLTIKFFGIMLIIVALGLCGSILSKSRIKNSHSLITFDEFDNKEDILSLWDWLSRNVDSQGYRVYFEDTIGAYPSKTSKHRYNHVLALTSISTDIKQIGGWAGFTSAFGVAYNRGWSGYLFHTKDYNKLSEKTIAENLKLLNCKFIIAHSKDLVAFLKNIDILKQVAIIGDFIIFEYKNMIPSWGFEVKNKEKIGLKEISPDKYHITANGHVGDLIQLSLAYNSNWKAYYKNSKIPIIYNKALMQIKLPTTGNQTIKLIYSIDKTKTIVFFLIGMVIFIYLLFYIHNHVVYIKQQNLSETIFGISK